MPKFRTNQTKKLYLPSTAQLDDNDPNKAFVVVRERLSLEDLTTVRPEGNDVAKNIDTLVSYIQDWNYEDEAGEKLPITFDTVKQLEVEDFVYLLEQSEKAVEESQTDIPADEKKTLSATSTPSPITEVPQI